MEVILLEKIDNLGTIGDRVSVRAGYGRNFLLPKGKATLATAANIALFEERRAELEMKQSDELGSAKARAARLAELQLKIPAKAGTEGKIFGSVGTIDIAEACTDAGVPVERSEVRLPDGPLKMLGEHEVEMHLHSDCNVVLRLQVVADGEPAADIDAQMAAAEAPAPDDQGSADDTGDAEDESTG
jgi:large subunit ribosomal protein L9